MVEPAELPADLPADLPVDLPADLPPVPADADPASATMAAAGRCHLDPRHIDHGRLVGAIATAAVAFALAFALLIVLLAVDGLSIAGRWLVVAAAMAVIAGVGLLSWLWPAREHRHASYRSDADGLEFRHGVWWRREVHVPRSRIQHTDVSQGPLERRFGLATLHVFTAGTDHARVAVPGLAYGTAVAIRDQLLAGTDGDAV